MQIIVVYKSIEIALKYTKMTKSKKKNVKNLTLEWNQK